MRNAGETASALLTQVQQERAELDLGLGTSEVRKARRVQIRRGQTENLRSHESLEQGNRSSGSLVDI